MTLEDLMLEIEIAVMMMVMLPIVVLFFCIIYDAAMPLDEVQMQILQRNSSNHLLAVAIILANNSPAATTLFLW